LGLYIEGEHLIDFLLQSLHDYFIIEGNLVNGNLVAYVLLNALWVHIPILLVIVSADMISGEHEAGTIRLLMSRDISRSQLIFSKFIVSLIYVSTFMLFLYASVLLPAHWIFGSGDLIVLVDGIQIILASEAPLRFLAAIAFGTLSMLAFTTMSLFFSAYFRNTLMAILISLGLLILSTLLHSFAFGMFQPISQWLFTHHMSNWQLLFIREVPLDQVWYSVIYLSVMILVFLSGTILYYRKIQITS
jgi:ABC-2 type transport system permease protein